MDHYGNKADLIERIVASNIKPSEVLSDLDRQKLSDMCSYVGLRFSGTKTELIERLVAFYDDLTFEERVTRDEREVWYNNYELLATRSYAELRAKKVIARDLDIEHQFEGATAFLFEARLQEAWKHPVLSYSLSYTRTIELEARLLEKEWTGEPGLFARLRLR